MDDDNDRPFRSPPERQLSESDAEADRIGEELLAMSGENEVHDWIKKSLNLLPPLKESLVYGGFRSDNDGDQDTHGDESEVAGATGSNDGEMLIAQDVTSQIRRSQSASVGHQYPHSYSAQLNDASTGTTTAGRQAGSIRFNHDVEGGLRRVTTYGGAGTSVRFGRDMSTTRHLRASGLGTEKIHLKPRRESIRMPSGFYGHWGTKGRGNVLVKVGCMAAIASAVLVGLLAGLFYMGEKLIGPPKQPLGAYKLLELQEGDAFWSYYNFYVGPDSIGSNGYLTYVSRERAFELGIANVTKNGDLGSKTVEEMSSQSLTPSSANASVQGKTLDSRIVEDDNLGTFIFMKSAATAEGPRESIRLEGKRRFHRGLFILDLRHMPTGCGVWPAFWLTDESNWPVNGEIDIVEGVNFQSVAKTALHSTQVCRMDDVPYGVKTGSWDTAVGIPNKKTGIPDMTMRDATNCYVYDPHQWLNQGCVAVDEEGGTLGKPLNDKGGGVYALDWDPANRHIRTYVFSPHESVPQNLWDSIRTAGWKEEERIAPDPDQWGLPYGYFPIGEATTCPAGHFRNMRLVFNLAFCGSVSGNRYNMDCPKQAKRYKTCNDWIKADPVELQEAYWKIGGVYVFEREWVNRWV